MKVHNEPIPEHKIGQFHEILCATGGRYLCNPYQYHPGCDFRVSYEPGDYKAMSEAWNLINTDVKEIRKDQLWRRLVRRIFK